MAPNDTHVCVNPTEQSADYDLLWTRKWGDIQRLGPTSRHQRRIVASMLDPFQIDRVLDVGCGEGSLLAFLGDRYRCSYLAGLDVARPAIERAQINYPGAAYIVGDIEAVPKQDPFDLVTCIDVLEHVEQDVELIRGMALVSRRFVLCGTIQGTMRRGEPEIGHVRNYCRGELQNKMVQAGLAIVREVEWGFPFYSPVFRELVAATHSEPLSFGTYGTGRRFFCHALYTLFLLNSWSRGDKVFVLGEKR